MWSHKVVCEFSYIFIYCFFISFCVFHLFKFSFVFCFCILLRQSRPSLSMLLTSWGPMKMLSSRVSWTCSLSLSLLARWAWRPWHRALRIKEAFPFKKCINNKRILNNCNKYINTCYQKIKNIRHIRKCKKPIKTYLATEIKKQKHVWKMKKTNRMLPLAAWAWNHWRQTWGPRLCQWELLWGHGDPEEAEGRDFLLIVLWFSLTFNVF